MVGGGDQLYCDPLTKEPEIAPWIAETDVATKIAAPVTDEMKFALDRFFFNWCVVRGLTRFAVSSSEEWKLIVTVVVLS